MGLQLETNYIANCAAVWREELGLSYLLNQIFFLIYYLAANNKTGLPANLVLLPKIIYFMTLLEKERRGGSLSFSDLTLNIQS